MRHLYLLLTVLFFGYRCFVFAQPPVAVHDQPAVIQLSLFYGINEVSSPAQPGRLDSLLQLAGMDSARIRIQGYADFPGRRDYNLALSQRRAEAVRSYLLGNTPGGARLQVMMCKGFGESGSVETPSPDGEPGQRRVDVLLEKRVMKQVALAKTRPGAASSAPGAAEAPAVTTNGVELLEKGESMEIKGLFFIPGRHSWTRDSEAPLMSLLKTMTDFPELQIEIQGHICCIAGPGDALDFDTNDRRLSENRARAVYDFLVASGIDPARLRYKGYGHSRPKITEERNSVEEQMNRRVEIRVVEK